jgi:hypothetical protein
LFEGYFLRTRPRNIAIGGGSALTGLAIIASYQKLPHLIFVETNILSRPVDEALEHVSAEQIRRVPNRIKGFSGGYLRQSLSALILFWSPSNANFVFC